MNRSRCFLPLWIAGALVLLGLAEHFGPYRAPIDWQLDRLRELAERGPETFWDTIPAAWDSGESNGVPVLSFDRRRAELDALGYDCVEVYRGPRPGLEAAEQGFAIDTPEEVVRARYVRRTQADHR